MRYGSMVLLPALLLALLTAGCESEPPRIDSTNDETFRASVNEVQQALPESEQAAFQDAVQTVMMSAFDFKQAMNGASPELMADQGMQMLDGMSASEVDTAARAIREKRRAQSVEENRARTAELSQQVSELQSQLEATSSKPTISVESVAFSYGDDEYFSRPTIDIAIRNMGAKAVSRAYFHSSVTSPGRSVPWVSEDFNYEIPGGVEPGELSQMTLTPNMFKGWSNVPKDRADITMEATPYRANDANGDPIFDTVARARLEDRISAIKAEISTLSTPPQ